MSTNEEFKKAKPLVASCRASVACGCDVDRHLADLLYYQCRDYVNDYLKRFRSDC